MIFILLFCLFCRHYAQLSPSFFYIGYDLYFCARFLLQDIVLYTIISAKFIHFDIFCAIIIKYQQYLGNSVGGGIVISNDRYDVGNLGAPLINRDAIHLLYVGNAKHGGDWNSLLHTHACAEIFYVVGGIGKFKIEDLVLSVQMGDTVIINPGVEHTEISLNASPLEYIVIGVGGLSFTPNEDADPRYCIVNFSQTQQQILQYLRALLAEVEEKAAGHELVCLNLLEVLLVHLMRHRDFPLVPEHAPAPVNKECVTIKRYLDSHFKESLTLDQLAQMSHISKFHLVHSFTKEYGVSPISYLINRRIEESKHLLRETNSSLSHISHILGFSSPSYFSQSFRRVEGISPIEYRKSCRAL